MPEKILRGRMEKLGDVSLLNLSALFDSAVDAVFIKDLGGNYLYVNEAGAALLGRSVAEVIGRNDTEFFEPGDAEQIRGHDRKIADSGESWTYEDLARVEGGPKVFRSTKTPLRDASGKVSRLLCVSREISAIKPENAFREELQRRKAHFLEESDEAFFVLDMDGCFRHANRKGQDFFGNSLESLLGKRASIWFPEEAKLLFSNGVPMDGQKADMLQYEAFHEGRQRYYSVRAYITSESRSYYLCDVTEKRRYETHLHELLAREKQARLEAQEAMERIKELSKVLTLFLWSYDPKTQEGWRDQSWFEYSGSLPGHDDFSNWLDYAPPEDRALIQQKWQKAMREGSSISLECKLRGKDGKYRWFLARGVPVRDDQGEVVRIVGVTTDIQVFKDLDEQRADFLSLASHELKTPLTSIQASLEMQQRILRQSRGGSPAVHDIERLLHIGIESTRRLAHLIDDLLAFSRFESGKLQVKPCMTDLADIVRAAVVSQRATLQLQERNEVLCVLPDRLEGHWDPLRMRQVMDNLIGNAIKYSPHHGTIEVRLQQIHDHAVLTVKDDGIGIAPEDQNRIFEPFERAVKSSNYGGFGIGLYVSARIIEQHRGKIEVDSELGQGACFKVSLPLQAPEHAPIQSGSSWHES